MTEKKVALEKGKKNLEAGGLVQVVEGLLWKHKALSSKPSPTKKKKTNLVRV
jgi:hypothetical protein